jgi:hypothetical protein
MPGKFLTGAQRMARCYLVARLDYSSSNLLTVKKIEERNDLLITYSPPCLCASVRDLWRLVFADIKI